MRRRQFFGRFGAVVAALFVVKTQMVIVDLDDIAWSDVTDPANANMTSGLDVLQQGWNDNEILTLKSNGVVLGFLQVKRRHDCSSPADPEPSHGPECCSRGVYQPGPRVVHCARAVGIHPPKAGDRKPAHTSPDIVAPA